ncbi:hypothetical protein [Pseudomonas phage Astolliot]|nr:hypothetical protein [Pseudomonas phage Astolliot]
MKTSETLAKAKSLIIDPVNWFKGDWVKPGDASCMCAMGAVAKANELSFESSEMTKVIGSKFEFYLAAAVGYEIPEASLYQKEQTFGVKVRRFALFNDNQYTTHEMLMTAFDKAIEMAQFDND